MLLEKKEIFVGLNGIKTGKDTGMRAGLYGSPNPSPQRHRKPGEMTRRNPLRKRPTYYMAILLVAGNLTLYIFVHSVELEERV